MLQCIYIYSLIKFYVIIFCISIRRGVFNIQDTLLVTVLHSQQHMHRAVFVRFSLGGGQSFDWRLATIADMEVAKLVPWNRL